MKQNTGFNVFQPLMAYVHEWIHQAALLKDSRSICYRDFKNKNK